MRSPFLSLCCYVLESLYVFSLQSLWSLYDVELDRLALTQAAETLRRDCREVYENIFAILTADKAIALRIVKPLNCSLFHVLLNSFFDFYVGRKSEDTAGRYCTAHNRFS